MPNFLPLKYLNDCLNYLNYQLNMSKKKKAKSAKPTKIEDHSSTKQNILKAAQQLFAEKTYESASVREIAEKAGANIALISYHFKNKDGLYTECLKEFGLSKLKTAREILTAPQTKEELKIRLEIFMRNMLSTFTTDMAAAKILVREMDADRPAFRPVIKEYIEPIFYTCVNFFEAAAKNKLINKKLDPMFISYTIFSTLCHAANSEKPMKRNLGHNVQDPKIQETIVQHVVHIVTEGVYS